MVRSSDRERVVDDLDDVRLAIKGALRLAVAGEVDDQPALVLIELSALLRFTAEALDRVVRRLDPSRDQS